MYCEEETVQILENGHASREVDGLARRARQLIGQGEKLAPCKVSISMQGRWFTISGRVDSQRTKSALFELVPEIDGARWIVDRVHVGPRSSGS